MEEFRPTSSSATTELLESLRDDASFAGLGNTTRTDAVHGFVETPMFLTLSLSHLRDALSALAEEEKRDYTTAARVAPWLVQSESDPIRFLRCENFNPFAAARRLVLYWEYRKRLFGDRWLLPFIESSDGALTKEDIQGLRSGWIAVAPRPPETPVLVMDVSRILDDDIDCRMRVVFYLFTVISDSSLQRKSLVVCQSLMRGRFVSLQCSDAGWTMLKRAFPARLSQVIILQPDKRGTLLDLYSTKLQRLLSEIFGPHMAIPVTIEHENQAADTLEALGIPKSCIPVTMGGLWTYDNLFDWKNHIMESDTAPVSGASLLNIGLGEDDDPERSEELSKARNALYSRRAYRRRKVKEEDAGEEAARVTAENAGLARENQRLQALFERATAYVQSLKVDDSEEPDQAHQKDDGQY